MSTTNIWYVDSTMVLELRNLTDEISGEPIVDALVTATLLDAAGAPVTGVTWPMTLSHVSEGTYRGSAPYAVAVQDKAKYTCRMLASLNGVQRRWDLPVVGRIDTH